MKTKEGASFILIFLFSVSLLLSSCKAPSESSDTTGGNNNGNPGGNGSTAHITDIKGNGPMGLYLTDAGLVYSAYLYGDAYGSSVKNYKVAGLSNIKKMAVAPQNDGTGNYEGLVLDGTGKLFTINMNFSNGKPDSALAFTQTSAFSGAVITDIAAGGDGITVFFLALDQSGRVWGWGNGGPAMYGIYSGTTPQLISGLSNISAISAGVSQALALNSSGSVYQWGTTARQYNTKFTVPTLNIGASPASLIDAGDNYNMAKRTDGSIYAWGHLMDGLVPGITNPTAISAGAELYYNPTFLKSDGTLVKTSFSMVNGAPQMVESVTELAAYTFSYICIKNRAFFVTTDQKVLIQASPGTSPYVLSTPLK